MRRAIDHWVRQVSVLALVGGCALIGLIGHSAAADPGFGELVDSDSVTIWSRVIGREDEDVAVRSVQSGTDGETVVVGVSESRLYVITIHREGYLESQRQIPWSGPTEVIRQATDGGFIAADTRNGDIRVVKHDVLGEVEWERRVGGEHEDTVADAVQGPDGRYAIVGERDIVVVGKPALWIVDEAGQLVGDYMYPEDPRILGGATAVRPTSDGGYAIVGSSGGAESYGAWAMYLVKTDGQGNLLWDQTYRDDTLRSETSISQWAFEVVETDRAGYFILGSIVVPTIYKRVGDETQVIDERSYHYLVSTDAQGNMNWEQTIPTQNKIRLTAAQETADGSVLLAGWARPSEDDNQSQVLLIKMSADGEPVWQRVIQSEGSAQATALHRLETDDFLVVGTIQPDGSDRDAVFLMGIALGDD